jgi:adenylate cyclase
LRGMADRIDTVLWMSDLHGFSRIADAASPETIIPFLNDYAEAVISAIEQAGGEVLKLIGDGTLAIFNATDAPSACRCALRAEQALRDNIAALNARRTERGEPITSVYLAMHRGDVFYGNVGSEARLDFTVVGPAVNEVSRMLNMCRSVERDLLVSSAFIEAMDGQAERKAFVSVGRFALRGFSQARDLFTMDPALLDAG